MIDPREALQAVALGIAVVVLALVVAFVSVARADTAQFDMGWPVVSEEVDCG